MIRVPRPIALHRPFALAAALLLFAAPASAAKVYQWKDARGVTHYSDAPPPGRAHAPRELRPAAPATSKPIVNTDCTNARSNLQLLRGAGPVGLDANRDGQSDRPLTDAERANRIERATRDVDTYCEAALDRR